MHTYLYVYISVCLYVHNCSMFPLKKEIRKETQYVAKYKVYRYRLSVFKLAAEKQDERQNESLYD
uniref:Uncharacterized protein n=1 Tax=Octopus bimaculoides TaxID=37653 RepID=A0A0L8G3I4_OCTBM